MQGTYSGADKRLKYLFEHANEVTLTGLLKNGTTIGTLTIDGSPFVLKVPSGGGGSDVEVTPIITDGIPIATITVDENPYTIECPDYSSFLEDNLETTETEPGQEPVVVYNKPTFVIGMYNETPVYVPAGVGIAYDGYYNQGISVGKFTVRYIGNDPEDATKAVVIDKNEFEIIIPSSGGGGSIVSWAQFYNEGIKIATITINGTPTDVYIPEGGSGNVDDVRVNGTSVVENKIADIDLTGYQTSLQADIDRIYNVCVSMGHTPPSHGFADVMLTAMSTLGGIQSRDVESTLEINMRYFGHAKEV